MEKKNSGKEQTCVPILQSKAEKLFTFELMISYFQPIIWPTQAYSIILIFSIAVQENEVTCCLSLFINNYYIDIIDFYLVCF